MVDQNLKLSSSVEDTLSARGLKLIKKLGEGSYAKVYLAELQNKSPPKNQGLACKIVDAAKAPKDFVKKFLPRELDILLKLNHPHIIHVHSIFQRKLKYFILMRFAENGDLLQYILKNGQLSENQSRVWVRQMAVAVQYLHEIDIAHRDLKCENVLITQNQNAKLSDFGFARLCVDSKRKAILSSTYCGSLSYAAPEVLRGTPYAPKGADVWSFGVLLYVMLNKSMPFEDTHVRKLYELQMKKKWKFRTKVVGSLTDQCKNLVLNMLEPEVSKRYAIDQVVKSDWFSMDSRFKSLNPVESLALKKAKEEKLAEYSEAEKRGGLEERSLAGVSKVEEKLNIIKDTTDLKFPDSNIIENN